MCVWLIILIILSTVIFVSVICDIHKINKYPYHGGDGYDGNGKYQYKGRGCKCEDIDVLLSRIDWLAKNSENKLVYRISYCIAYVISIGLLVFLYVSDCYLLNVWNYAMVLIISFIVAFSITNLLDFHGSRYPNYYIRENCHLISKKLKTRIRSPSNPCYKSKIPHRTCIREMLSK